MNSLKPGFLLVNKPKGITSFDCIRRIKKLLPPKTKIGHTGTLDPFADGLMILCIGREATRLSFSLLSQDKIYRAQGKLGELSDTLDLTGKIIETQDASHITKQTLHQAIAKLGDSYLQTPPLYSALKHEGRPLYDLVRKESLDAQSLQKIAQDKAKKVRLFSLELLEFEPPFFTIEAHVSKGTYIRVLINDLAKLCGSVATTYALTRAAIGPFSLNQAHNLEYFDSQEKIEQNLINVDEIATQN